MPRDSSCRRLSALLQQTQGQVKLGGASDAASRYMQTTLLTVKEDDVTMQEEVRVRARARSRA